MILWGVGFACLFLFWDDCLFAFLLLVWFGLDSEIFVCSFPLVWLGFVCFHLLVVLKYILCPQVLSHA